MLKIESQSARTSEVKRRQLCGEARLVVETRVTIIRQRWRHGNISYLN